MSAFKKGRLYDHGNFVQACKALLDSLQPSDNYPGDGVIFQDSPAWLVDYYTQENCKQQHTGTLVAVFKLLGETREPGKLIDFVDFVDYP